jgi:hypothetical protein
MATGPAKAVRIDLRAKTIARLRTAGADNSPAERALTCVQPFCRRLRHQSHLASSLCARLTCRRDVPPKVNRRVTTGVKRRGTPSWVEHTNHDRYVHNLHCRRRDKLCYMP